MTTLSKKEIFRIVNKFCASRTRSTKNPYYESRDCLKYVHSDGSSVAGSNGEIMIRMGCPVPEGYYSGTGTRLKVEPGNYPNMSRCFEIHAPVVGIGLSPIDLTNPIRQLDEPVLCQKTGREYTVLEYEVNHYIAGESIKVYLNKAYVELARNAGATDACVFFKENSNAIPDLCTKKAKYHYAHCVYFGGLGFEGLIMCVKM